MNLPQIQGYDFEDLIGEGGCGAVYRCRYRQRNPRAVKVLNGLAVNPGLLSHALTTVANLPRHRRIVPIHTYNLGQKPYYYATDLYQSESGQVETIAPLAGKLERTQSWRMVEQLIDGLAWLHKHDVVHTCIKPSNIFVTPDEENDSWHLHLGDFGLGLVSGLHYYEMRDSGFFAAPEQLTHGDFSHGKGKRWDVYSFGVVTFLLMTGKLPRLHDEWTESNRQRDNRAGHPTAALHQDNPLEIFDALQKQPQVLWPNRPRNEYEANLRGVIDRCLDLDPSKRPVDMRDVARTFENIRHEADLAVIKRRHAAQSRGKAIRIKVLLATTGLFILTSIGLLAAALVGFAQLGTATLNIAMAEADKDAALRAQAKDYEKALTEAHDVRDEALADAAYRQELADEARDFLHETIDNADRFLDMIVEADDVDYPGFQETRRDRLTQALAYFDDFRERYGSDPDFGEEVALAQHYVARLLEARGELSEALVSFDQAIEANTALTVAPEERPAHWRKIGVMHRDKAEILLALERPDEAMLALEDATRIFQELFEISQDDRYQLELAENLFLHARLEKQQRNWDTAMADLDTVVEALLSLRKSVPLSETHKAILGRSFIEIGLLLRRNDKIDAALEVQKQAAELMGQLIAENGQREDYQYYLAVSLNQRGEMLQDKEMILDAHEILTRIVELEPDRHRYRLELANSYGRLAEIQRDQDQMEDAEDLINQSLKILVGLVQQEPGIEAYRLALAVDNVELAQLMVDQEKFEEATQRFFQSIQVMEELREDNEDDAEYMERHAGFLGSAGYSLEQQGEDEAAKEHYEDAVSILKKLSNQSPEDPKVISSLDWTERQLERLVAG